jgi:hypothetical protein
VSQPSLNYDDAEYRRSTGAAVSGAVAAWNSGATGQGIRVGVIDTGINPNLPDFEGRIDSASRDVGGTRGIADSEGHGTAVSAVIAANRNGSGILGIAFNATVISLNTSNPNNCTEEKGCKHSDSAIASAIDVANQNGARVINISLGGEGVSPNVLAAVQRATAQGIVIVVSAGNEGTAEQVAANPTVFASEIARAGNGLVIVAGSVGLPVNGNPANGIDHRSLSTFSNRAGISASTYLTAVGYRVIAPDETGGLFYWSGTSFSAPVISGAAALLASAFPNLTGAQIVEILLSTADDAGGGGTDASFGRGILNITRAFQPQGLTTVAGSAEAISTTSNGQASGTMGDAEPLVGNAVVLDGYSRAYGVDIGRTVRAAPRSQPLSEGLQQGVRTTGGSLGTAAFSVTVRQNLHGQPEVGLAQEGMSYEDSRRARAIAGYALSRLTPRTAAAFGFSESGRALQQRLAGDDSPAFLIARDPLSRTGFVADSGASLGVRHELGSIGLTGTAERGEVRVPGIQTGIGRPGYTIGALSADRRIGNGSLRFGVSRLDEESTVLGGQFAFGRGGSTTYFADASATYDFGGGWNGQASYRRGWTALPGGDGLVRGGSLVTDAFSVDLSRRDAFARGDRLAFRIMQPLRVLSGGYQLNLPVSYNYADGSVGYEQRLFNLAPNGREIDFEAAYALPVLGGAGDLSANAFLRRQPGHFQAMNDDIGAALRFTLGF